VSNKKHKIYKNRSERKEIGRPGLNSYDPCTIEFSVTKHCAIRFGQRVLNYPNNWIFSRQDLMKMAESIAKIIPDISNKPTGIYPFIDNLKIVIKGGKAITIK